MGQNKSKNNNVLQKSFDNPRNWFYWGKWDPNILTVSLCHKAITSKTFKNMGINFSGNMKCLGGNYFFLKSDFQYLHKTLEKQKIYWFKKFLQICESETNSLVNARETLENFLGRLSNFLGCILLITFIDRWLDEKIKKICKKNNISYDVVLRMMQLEQKTPLMLYQEALKNLKLENIKKFVKKWEWVGTHAFGGKLLTKKVVLESLKQAQIQTKKEVPILLKNNTKLHLNKDLRQMMNIGKQLSFHRSNMIEQMNKSIFKRNKEMMKIARERKLRYEDIIRLTYDEILNLIRDKQMKILIKRRNKNFGFIATNGEIRIVFGEDIQKEKALHEIINSSTGIKIICGTIACRGIVRGIARVVTSSNDLKKVKLGDILVAPETTPDYVMAMQKASAFITNQGGITSHAAIIAREMNKPCIIGTKIATQIFRDGDLVEVDANAGIVKKLTV